MGGPQGMAVRSVRAKPRKQRAAIPAPGGGAGPRDGAEDRYRRLPTGTHGLDPEEIRRDQRERLRSALIELVARRGYPAVRILDVSKLARVSRPTFYGLYANKEALFLDAYDEISVRAARTVTRAYRAERAAGARDDEAPMRVFCELAAAEPEAMSLFVLGAFGAGAKALERRKRTLQALEQVIRSSRNPGSAEHTVDLTAKVLIGGTREVTAARLRRGRSGELPGLAGELAAWAACYPHGLPERLEPVEAPRSPQADSGGGPISERARRAKGRLPSGRHALPRTFILKSQRERIVDATASIVAARGLAGLTIPEIARHANVSHQTFYEIYETKHDAFLGALKVGMHQALLVFAKAYDAHSGDWPRALVGGLRALIEYVVSEPVHAHLSLVDTFAASPEAIEIRDSALAAFAAHLTPGYELARGRQEVPLIAVEAITGGIWQILHDYVDDGRISELGRLAPQVGYLALVPFLGPDAAADAVS